MAMVPVGHWITPPEVGEIANRFRVIADQIRTVYASVNAMEGQLEQSWRGNAKNIFDAHFNSFPREILAYADDLDHIANEILNIQIWVLDEE